MPARTTAEKVRERLKLKQLAQAVQLAKKYPKAARLLSGKGLEPAQLRQHSAKLLAGATLASALLAGPAASSQMLPGKTVQQGLAEAGITSKEETRQKLATRLKEILPEKTGKLTAWQEEQISKSLEEAYGVHAVPELEGNRLNDQYGWTGAEQHLKRFPGDQVGLHDEEQASGIALGLGAWGYFAPSQEAMTEEDELREKYYVAVQTLYLADWNTRFAELRDWYKYRKVVMVNPENGKAVVAVVGDSGPAAWTGKVFGGSPEVMKELDLHTGLRKGEVILFFVDDPGDKVPLGPLEYNLGKVPLLG